MAVKRKHMKTRYLMFLPLVLLAGCVQPEYPDFSYTTEDGTPVRELSVKGQLASDSKTDFPSVIDESSGIVTIQVPFYLSDTERIQGDLTKMRISATLPVGATFKPSITGIHDLSEGFSSTLTYPDGVSKTYTFRAEYVKSDLALLTDLRFSEVTVFSIGTPSGGKAVITVQNTGSNADILASATPVVSPWSTISGKGYDSDSNILDLSTGEGFTVTSQSGNVSTEYSLVYETPKTVDYGVSQIKALFGIQPVSDDMQGFTSGANTSMAVIGKYLILSNVLDFSNMPVYNRTTGEYLQDVKVNTTGVKASAVLGGITSDDAGHLVAVSRVDIRPDDRRGDAPYRSNVLIYVWKDGIESAPTCVLDTDIKTGEAFQNEGQTLVYNGSRSFYTVSVKGDITSGKATLASAAIDIPRPFFLFFNDGEIEVPVYVEWPSGLAGTAASMWYGTKVIPMTEGDASEYYWTSAHFRSVMIHAQGGGGLQFNIPASHWWPYVGGYDFQHPNRGMDLIEFNGAHLLAVASGTYAGKQTTNQVNLCYWRLYVADVTASPTENALIDGFLFDSREGDSTGTDAIPGSGFSKTGMLSPFAYDSGKTVPIADEYLDSGDVVFAAGSDGLSVQVYMMETDQGILGYNLSSVK